MKKRLLILTEIIAPYRIPVFNALAAREEVDLHVIFLSETDCSLRQWRVERERIQFSYEVLRSFRRRIGKFNLLLTNAVAATLERNNPDVILAGGYNYLAMWQARRWARRRAIPLLLWSESNARDKRRNLWWVEFAKRRFIRSCQAHAVAGSSSAEYIKSFGVETEKIFVAPDAVDVERFARGADEARRDPNFRVRFELPDRYFLYVGRFVQSKGVFDLLSAYANLPDDARRKVGLVFVGDGEEREELARRSRNVQPGYIRFPGFMPQDELPALYAWADAFVFPTHSDPWGLVVNEAMACRLPVIATDVAGCTADLVRDRVNGYVVSAGRPELLSQAMLKLLNDPELRNRMGQERARIIQSFTPETWAKGVVRAIADRDPSALKLSPPQAILAKPGVLHPTDHSGAGLE